jgi:hypothetical protein
MSITADKTQAMLQPISQRQMQVNDVRRRPSVFMRQENAAEHYRRASVAVSPQRRMSMWLRRPSVASSFRLGLKDVQPRIQYENTYRIEPGDNERFHASKVEHIIEDVMRSYLDGESYDARKCAQMTLRLSDLIKERIKDDLNMPRHKLVCTVVIGQSSGQCVRYASRCVWNPTTDGHATGSFKNNSLFATATVFGVYFE